MEIVVGIVIGLVVGVLVLLFVGAQQRQRVAQVEAKLSEREAHLAEAQQELTEAKLSVAIEQERTKSAQQTLADYKAQQAEQQKQLQTQFENLATKVLTDKSAQFQRTNQDSMEAILKPFKENIDSFRKRVDEVYGDESKQRFSLQKEIERLSNLNQQMSQEASNLASALKGSSKVQGDWGEMILETMLDRSNLIKGQHYETQHSVRDEESGAQLRPDVILHLPEGKQVVIDSKVSLKDYVAYTEAQSEEERAAALKAHLGSMQNHVKGLSDKEYQKQFNSPDFVIMFVPTEPAFLLALQHDSELWNRAYDKRVIISSPTNLFALLKIVDDLWKRDTQSKRALDIAKAGGDLYDKFMGFADRMAKVGKSLTAATTEYDTALKQLKEGRGNLIKRAQDLKAMGIKASKTLPPAFEGYDEQEESAE